MSTQWKTGSGSFNNLSVESAQFILDIGKFCNWISFFLADGQHLSLGHNCFWAFWVQNIGYLTTTELSNKTSNNWLNGIAIVFPFVPLMNLLFYLLHQFLKFLERFCADCMFHPACIMICSFWRYPISSKNLLRNSAVLHFIYYIGHVHCGYSVGYQDNRFLLGRFFQWF